VGWTGGNEVRNETRPGRRELPRPLGSAYGIRQTGGVWRG
jgi:hypothetical protein